MVNNKAKDGYGVNELPNQLNMLELSNMNMIIIISEWGEESHQSR